MTTPICDFVRRYAEGSPLRLHMPGHKGVGPLGVEALDITEVPGADVLYDPAGIIAESEANAAALFGSAATVYSAEGSSLCIRAMLCLAQLWAKDRGKRPLILAGRNAHRSFLSAAALLDAEVDWLFSEGKREGVLSCSVTPESLDRRLAAVPEAGAAVYITSPDYLGNRAGIAALSEVCRRHGALLLVDNAHGAYLRFLEQDLHPLTQGADLCCDSAHKTLPVLTGGAYLHIGKNAPPPLKKAANRAMALFASTSPSYLILQSLDAANALLAGGLPEELRRAAARLDSLRRALAADGWVLMGDEPLKLTLRPKARGYTGTAVAEHLARRGIVAEFADPDFVVCMAGPACGDGERLRDALDGLAPRTPIDEPPPALCLPRRVLSPRQAMLAPAETLPAEWALDRVLASPCVSCPPAVPVLVCGEAVGMDAVHAFRYYGIERVEVVRRDFSGDAPGLQ